MEQNGNIEKRIHVLGFEFAIYKFIFPNMSRIKAKMSMIFLIVKDIFMIFLLSYMIKYIFQMLFIPSVKSNYLFVGVYTFLVAFAMMLVWFNISLMFSDVYNYKVNFYN